MALKYAQLREVECMRAIARAHQNRNLADFEKALKDYRDGLYFRLFDQFLTKIERLAMIDSHCELCRAVIRPYYPDTSRCAIRHVTRTEPTAHS